MELELEELTGKRRKVPRLTELEQKQRMIRCLEKEIDIHLKKSKNATYHPAACHKHLELADTAAKILKQLRGW